MQCGAVFASIIMCLLILPCKIYGPRHFISLYHSDKLVVAHNKLINTSHVCFITQDLVQGLQTFVRTNYPQGIKWNPSGVSLQEAKAAAAAGGAGGKAPAAAAPAASAAPAAAPAGGRGPPPPPPPGALLQERPAKGSAAAAGGGAAAAGGGGGPSRGDLLAALQKVRGQNTRLEQLVDVKRYVVTTSS